MSNILYYSKYCEHSKKLLSYITTNNLQTQLHFICIDKRHQDQSGKIYIIMDNGERIIMPENVQSVPAMLLLNQNYRVVYGDEIYNALKPVVKENVRVSTQNNMEPSCFSFQGGASMLGVSSDNFSFLDQGAEELGTKGAGGQRQMYNYVSINENGPGEIQTPTDDFDYSSETSGMSLEQLQQKREEDFKNSMDKMNTERR
mgnify:CR=1 FL=1|jgi:precorrin-6B methylase 1|uniref:Glutaredoxin domain-containing protein n=1 Tax=viral metagenome TaxID=1070528 RepID=A0A6C0ILZ9_9ZZZZ